MGGFQEKEIINYLEKNGIIPRNYYNLPVIFTSGFASNKKD